MGIGTVVSYRLFYSTIRVENNRNLPILLYSQSNLQCFCSQRSQRLTLSESRRRWCCVTATSHYTPHPALSSPEWRPPFFDLSRHTSLMSRCVRFFMSWCYDKWNVNCYEIIILHVNYFEMVTTFISLHCIVHFRNVNNMFN